MDIYFSPPSNPAQIRPSDFGYRGWTHDPLIASGQGQPVTGRIYYNRFRAASTGTASKITFKVQVNGSSLTAGQSLMAIYDTGQTTAGTATRLALSPDLSTVWNATGLFTTTLTSSASLIAGQDYFVATLCVGTTPPFLVRQGSSSDFANRLLSGLSLRSARSATGSQTSLPATFVAADIAANPDQTMFTLVVEP